MAEQPQKSIGAERLHGLDLARFLAFVGMVIVNFGVVVAAVPGEGSWASALADGLEGRAAATFVVLAGVGLGMGAKSAGALAQQTVPYLLIGRRALFLLVIGLLNMMIFEADIIHYYAGYFLFGAACLRFTSLQLSAVIAAVVFGFLVLVVALDYDQGWVWATYTYTDFWTPTGFVRNLFYNGWHPVIPWLAFLLFGVIISRLSLTESRTQLLLLGLGVFSALSAHGLSQGLTAVFPAFEGESLVELYGVKPVPPMPLYMLAGMGISAATIGVCLLLASGLKTSKLLTILVTPGRQTLTLYFAHIFIGMGLLDVFGLVASPGNSVTTTMSQSVVMALAFGLAALIYANIWSRFFKRGPVEWLMRRLAG
jgi:uncharacterized protein